MGFRRPLGSLWGALPDVSKLCLQLLYYKTNALALVPSWRFVMWWGRGGGKQQPAVPTGSSILPSESSSIAQGASSGPGLVLSVCTQLVSPECLGHLLVSPQELPCVSELRSQGKAASRAVPREYASGECPASISSCWHLVVSSRSASSVGQRQCVVD